MTRWGSPVEVAVIITRFMAGAGGVALRGALALDRERFHTTIYIGSGDRLIDRAREADITVVEVPSIVPELSPKDDAAAVRDLQRLLERHRPAVVHTHSAKAGAVGRLAAARVGVPTVVHTYHGFPFHEFQSRLRRQAYIQVERMLARRTHVFLAVGASVAAEAVRRGIADPTRLYTIAPSVDPRPHPPAAADRARARRLLDISPGVTVVGTVGRLDYQKAPETLITAVAKLQRDDVVLVWVGDGPLRAYAEGVARRLHVADRVRFIGDRDDVTDLLPGLDVFAMSSRYEGLPCAIVEAMEAGLPVVATAVNAVPDLVIPGETGVLVAPEDPGQLADALRYLIDEPAAGVEFATAALGRLGDRFAPQRLGSLLERIYAPGTDDRLAPALTLLPAH